MDITAIKSAVAQDEVPVVVEIYQRNGEPYLAADGTPSTVSVLGAESAAYRKAVMAQRRKLLRSRKPTLEPEDLEANAIELAAAAVTDWHGWENGGAPLPPTPENVRSLLSIEHIRTQVEAGIERHAAFFGSASAT